MNVTQVTTTIHEKRNHPHEYGHYDASVTLTADIEPGESAGDAIGRLRNIARLHVAVELDDWIFKVEEQRRVHQVCDKIEKCLDQLRWVRTTDAWTAQIVETKEEIATLPDYLQEEWKEKLERVGEEVYQNLMESAEEEETVGNDEIAF